MIKRLLLCALMGGALSAVVGVGPAAAAPPTAVTCGSTIAAPGQYYLAGDCTGPGITITASKVHLKLEGHTMTSSGGFVGIRAQGVSKLHLQGPGTITNYNSGVGLSFVDGSRVEKVAAIDNNFGFNLGFTDDNRFDNNVATGNNGPGFAEANSSGNRYVNVTGSGNANSGMLLFSSTATHIAGSVANDNGLRGIDIFGNSTAIRIDGSTANGNGARGISIDSGATGNDVHGNTALGNGLFDLFDGNPGCDSNDWDGNHFNTANQPCIS